MTPRDAALAFAVTASWGAGLTIAKGTMEQFPPIFLMTIALAATALAMQLWERGEPTTSHARAAFIAFFAVTLQTALIFKGLAGLEASTGGLLTQVQVPIAILAAWLWRTEPVDLSKLVPIAIALIGAGIVIGMPATPPPMGPTLTMLAGATAWSVGQVMIARYAQDGATLLLKRTALHGAIQLALLSALFETGQMEAVRTASPAHWAGLAYNTFIAFVLAYVIWYGLLKRNPVSAVTPFIMIIPVMTLATAALFLGETIGPAKLAGGALILTGVAWSSGIIKFPMRPSQ